LTQNKFCKTEDKLILYLADVDAKQMHLNKIMKLISDNIDWTLFVGRAIHNRVLSRVYQNIQSLENLPITDLIPESALTLLDRSYKSFIGNNLLVIHEAKLIVNEFLQAEINVFLLNPNLMLPSLYPDKQLRFIQEINYYIPDFASNYRSSKIIQKFGYKSIYSDRNVRIFQKTRSKMVIDCNIYTSLSLFNFFKFPNNY